MAIINMYTPEQSWRPQQDGRIAGLCHAGLYLQETEPWRPAERFQHYQVQDDPRIDSLKTQTQFPE
jgi:hypothetical protein